VSVGLCNEFFLGWLAVGLAIFLPAAFRGARRMRGREWERQGLCRRGGYDVRASRTRCPECGAFLPYRPRAPLDP